MLTTCDEHTTAAATPKLDDLESICHELLMKGAFIGYVPFARTSWKIQDVTSVLWMRQGQIQVQLFIVPANYVIPEHTHPNVDSIEVYLGGQIKFSHRGKWVVPEVAFSTPGQHGLAAYRGATLRVRPSDPHGGVFGPAGGVFFSIQHWLNGVEPHCVAADYTGVVMGRDHYEKVVAGAPTFKAHLTAQDAASAEVA